ncbi:hypothetical protein FGO68_gene8379 [Halteria grandinella]|uniref:Uncharacterized protein n=1 Tax=Halteria grandinella TaxID=5974 RepID=A0A8J8NK18_HALGN|nr:hypothetical protein FGO68_gene8379 [Halteria grandinella]
MSEIISQHVYKVIILGDSYAGKTSFIKRYILNEFNKYRSYNPGQDFFTKSFSNFPDNNKRTIEIQDTVGQERYRSFTYGYFRNADACILAFSIADMISFENVKYWAVQLEQNSSDNIHKILIGCKSDVGYLRAVTYDEAIKMAVEFGMKYVETSAKTGDQVNEAMEMLLEEVFKRPSVRSIGLDAVQLERNADLMRAGDNCFCIQ